MRRNEDGEKKPTSRDVFIAARRLLFRAAAPAFVYFVFLYFFGLKHQHYQSLFEPLTGGLTRTLINI